MSTAAALLAPRPAYRRGTAPAPRLRVVVTPARRIRRRRRTMLWGWGIAITLLTVVAFHVVLAQNQVALDRLERRTSAAERRYEEWRFQYAQASSPARIMERAAQLGLTSPAIPPAAVPVAGQVPEEPDATTGTLNGWTDVKPTLGPSP